MVDITLVQQAENSSSGATSCSLTLENCTVGNTLILAYAIRGSGNNPTLSDGWEVIGGGNVVSYSSDNVQKIYFASKKVENATEIVTLTQTTTGIIYIVCGEFSGYFSVVMRDDMANRGTTEYTVTANKDTANDVILYAVSSAYYVNSGGRLQVCEPSDLTKLQGNDAKERLACWFDDGSGEVNHTFHTCNSTGNRDAIVECVQFVEIKKYLVRDGGTIYTVADGALAEVSGTLNADLFIASGVDTIPDGALLMTLSAPEVLCWTDGDRLPKLTATVQGVPQGTHEIISDNARIGHESVYGITSVEATASDGATFLLSFDGGMWMAYTNGSWSASDVGMNASELMAVPTEAWSSVINSANNMRLKAMLDGLDTVTQVKFNFNNNPSSVTTRTWGDVLSEFIWNTAKNNTWKNIKGV